MSYEMAKKIVKALDDKKAVNLQIIDIKDISQVADYFIICSGTSTTHVKALADEVEFQMGNEIEHEVGYHKEGYSSALWILLDYKDVIVHIFCGETRDFYNIEHLWSDGKKIDFKDFLD
ncbi:MAG: ribosome silencing factor [Clostridia bacterium]|nr:ribosome silencing factor [Clostridia bacterium]